MEVSPALDVDFQRMLAKIIAQVLDEHELSAPDSETSVLARQLLERRVKFEEVWLFPYSDPSADGIVPALGPVSERAARQLEHLNEVRNTPQAQAFLLAKPGFFEALDRKIFRAIIAGRTIARQTQSPTIRQDSDDAPSQGRVDSQRT